MVERVGRNLIIYEPVLCGSDVSTLLAIAIKPPLSGRLPAIDLSQCPPNRSLIAGFVFRCPATEAFDPYLDTAHLITHNGGTSVEIIEAVADRRIEPFGNLAGKSIVGAFRSTRFL